MNRYKSNKITKIIKSMGCTPPSEIRQIFVQLDDSTGRAFFEIEDSFTALGFFKLLEKDPEVKFDDKSSTFKFSAPINYYWKSEIMSKVKGLDSTLIIWWL